MAQPIPIVIINFIDGVENRPFYKAFSPGEFFPEGNHALQKQEFIERVINWADALDYYTEEAMYVEDNLTSLAERGTTCYFSTYTHWIDDAHVICPGMVAFNRVVAAMAAAGQPNLIHAHCPHEFL